MLLLSGDHDGAEHAGSFWRAWPSEPPLLLGIVLAAALYGLGWFRLRRSTRHRVYPAWRAWCFAGGLAAIATSVLSPVAVYSERLFFMHMVQHLLLLLVAPPLLWLGAPLVPTLWGLPEPVRRRVGRRLVPHGLLARLGNAATKPLPALVLYVAAVAIWHVPAFYDRAQGQTITHNLEHLAFLGTALLYWWPVVHPSGGRRRLSVGWAIPYLLPPMLEGMLIGALITFADRPLYRTYAGMEPTWGFTAVGDQELGGLIMWVPGGMLFLIPLLGLLAALLQREGKTPPARRASG